MVVQFLKVLHNDLRSVWKIPFLLYDLYCGVNCTIINKTIKNKYKNKLRRNNAYLSQCNFMAVFSKSKLD